MSTKRTIENEECCGNCLWFNGENGDGMQFCDERELYVHESGCCTHYAAAPERIWVSYPSCDRSGKGE